MSYEPYGLILVPVGLGLLGFVEPCTIGAHLLFLRAIAAQRRRWRAMGSFILTRTLVTGLIGVLFALLGRSLIDVQTGLWLVFGSVYLGIGIGYAAGWQRLFVRRLTLSPTGWQRARNPALLGAAFGLNIPACAAPLIFGLFTLSAGSASLTTGFGVMALFGLSLSVPLLGINALSERDFPRLQRLKPSPRVMRSLSAGVFILLGLWSIWFGLFVNPENWSGQ